MILAGGKSDVKWGDGNWVFFDVGFSNNGKTCGLVFEDRNPECLHYGEAKRRIVEHIRTSDKSVKLVIEAPLSVCFDARGNPKGRQIEREGSKTRYWYSGLGCCVTTAATYLIREIHEARLDVVLFEGFVTFKEPGTKSKHADEVCRLREVVRHPEAMGNSIYSAEELRCSDQDRVISAFALPGQELGVPAVIRA
jgi:hypothetical protein